MASPPSLLDLTIEDVQRGLASHAFTSADLVTAYLDRIRELNPLVRAVAEVDSTALEQARILDAELAEGKSRGPLHGVPLLLENQIATSNLNNTAGSTALLGARTGRDSALVEKLRRAGAIILGMANMSQWGFDRDPEAGNGWSADAGQTLGVYVSNQDPWGSSSGSATGTALGLTVAAIGTEVEGNIVCAAERSNVCGLKPTVGLVTHDLILVSRRFGSAGPIARSVIDLASILSVIAGKCDRDTTTAAIPFDETPDYTSFCRTDNFQGARIGVPRNALKGRFPDASVTPDMVAIFDEAIEILRQSGATIIENTDFTAFDDIITDPSQGIVKASDYKKLLADYLGQLRVNPANVHDIHDIIRYTQTDLREEYPSRKIRGLETTAAGIENQNSKEFQSALATIHCIGDEGGVGGTIRKHQLDAVILPTAIGPLAAAIGGYPILTVPLGFHPDESKVEMNPRQEMVARGPGVPFGLAFIGDKFSEDKIIQYAYAYEQRTQRRMERRPIFQASAQLPGFWAS